MATGGLVLAGTLAVVGAVFTVAFDQAFTLFHEVFFPGGNWSFDPRTERMVQLYPTPFWELTATVLTVVAIVLGLLVRVAARRVAAAREPVEAAA
jgi:integral membrane protein (TIGR01906 family)